MNDNEYYSEPMNSSDMSPYEEWVKNEGADADDSAADEQKVGIWDGKDFDPFEVDVVDLEAQIEQLNTDVEKALAQLEHAENILKACLLAAETNTVGASVAPEAIVIRRMVERYFAIKSLPF